MLCFCGLCVCLVCARAQWEGGPVSHCSRRSDHSCSHSSDSSSWWFMAEFRVRSITYLPKHSLSLGSVPFSLMSLKAGLGLHLVLEDEASQEGVRYGHFSDFLMVSPHRASCSPVRVGIDRALGRWVCFMLVQESAREIGLTGALICLGHL